MGKRFDKCFRLFASHVLSLIARVKFNARKTDIELPEPGSLVICNHTSVWDFCYMVYALRPLTNLRFVATGRKFDSSRFVAWVFRHLGLIRKDQGTSDLVCVKEIIKGVRAGDVVILYAAGMTSYDGTEAWVCQSGTGSLARMLKANVYAGVVHGAFLSSPRYAFHSYRGRVDISVKKLFSGAEAASRTAEALQRAMNRAISFNDWDWQEKQLVPFRGMKKLHGITYTLYQCPTCRKEGTLSVENGRILCGDCGFAATRDRYGFFRAQSGSCPRRMDAWSKLEIASLRGVIDSGELCLTEPGTLQMQLKKDDPAFVDVERGTLTLTNEYLCFDGQTKPLRFGVREFQYFIVDEGIHFIQFFVGGVAYGFVFDNPKLITRWFYAHRILADGSIA